MTSIPTTVTFNKRRSWGTIVHSPPNTSGHPSVISTMSSKVETESETETDTDVDNSTDEISNRPNSSVSENYNDSFINQYLGRRDFEEIENQMGLPESRCESPLCFGDKDKGKVPEHNDVGIQTEGDIKVDSENNPEKLVLLGKKAQYASLNIEMTGGTIVKPVFNILADGRGKRKASTHREGQTTAKKTKKAKINF
ncbi:hypothetical protein JOM56_004778 [Amanita muscaria]